MKIFVSYTFSAADRWVEEFVIPLIHSLGFDVVSGRHIEGDPVVATVNQLQSSCDGCIAFTTRRIQRRDGSYETHPWVVHELTTARTLRQKAIEVREAGVRLGDANEAFAYINYDRTNHNQMIFELVNKLASWKSNRIRIQLVPPDTDFREFRTSVARRRVKCKYEIQKVGEREITTGEAQLIPEGDSCFVDIDIPSSDVLIQVFVVSQTDNSIAWASSYTGLLSIPVILH